MTLMESPVVTVPGPGVYPNVPADVYHSWQLASSHRLSLLGRSPAHMQHANHCPREQTPAMALGEAVHTCILEPSKWATAYAMAPECDRRTKDGKATWQQFLDECGDRKPITFDDAELCKAMRSAVLDHPAAHALLDRCLTAEVEVSAVWKCKATDVMCKLRADIVRPSLGVIVDIKTCEDAGRDAFERSIFNFKYYRQAGHYMRGLAANGIGVDGFVFIAVEKSPPYAVACYRLDDEVLSMGDEEIMRLLELYGKCERAGRWPGYPLDVQSIRIPQWAIRQFENQ